MSTTFNLIRPLRTKLAQLILLLWLWNPWPCLVTSAFDHSPPPFTSLILPMPPLTMMTKIVLSLITLPLTTLPVLTFPLATLTIITKLGPPRVRRHTKFEHKFFDLTASILVMTQEGWLAFAQGIKSEKEGNGGRQWVREMQWETAKDSTVDKPEHSACTRTTGREAKLGSVISHGPDLPPFDAQQRQKIHSC